MYTVGNMTIYRGERFPTVYSTLRYINRKYVTHSIYPRYMIVSQGISPTAYRSPQYMVPHGVCSPLDTPTVYNLHPRYMHVPTVYSHGISNDEVCAGQYIPWREFIYRGRKNVYSVGNRHIYRGDRVFYIPWGIYRGEQILYIPWGTCRVVQSIYSVAPQYKANASRYKANPTRYKT